MSRRSSVSHLTHDVMSSFGSYTSLSFRSTPGNGEASHRNRHSPRQHSHSHYHHRHHNHNHHYHGQNTSRKVYYQTHHTQCKRASGSHGKSPMKCKSIHPLNCFVLFILGSTESAENNGNRKHTRGSHRRKSSSSSFGGDSLRRRKRVDIECSSLHGSGLSLFEPLQVDVSTPSTNTVVLTPSKITIEHSSDYEGTRDKKLSANGRAAIKRNRYAPSPVQWTYAHRDELDIGTDRADFIEIISEPEDGCRSRTASATTSKAINSRAKKVDRIETPKKPSCQYDDTSAFPIWEMAKENNEHTIIFHHKSDIGDKCCDNYCPRNESDMEIMDFSADRSTTTKLTDEEGAATTASKAQFELLNNSTAATAANPNALVNFQKNNISQSGAHRFLDLSSDIRRYSKITNFEQQNASNLLPNYLSRSSNANLNDMPPGTSFELFNIPSASMYDKPFGSIHLTTQNHFETQSSSGE